MKALKFGWAAAAAAAAAGIAFAHPGHPPIVPATASYGADREAVPFDLFRGARIILTGTVNGAPTEMMLDSGAGMTVVDPALAEKLGLAGGVPISVRGASGEVPGRIVRGATLTTGALRLTDLSVLVVDMAPISRGVGRPIPVVLGRDAFKAGIVSIDFPNRKIGFAPREGFQAPAGATRLALSDKEDLPAVRLSVAGLPPVESHLDLGNGGAVLLAKDYWSKQPSIAALRQAETQVGGVGGMKLARRVTLPAVEFGGIRFANVPATLNDDPAALPTSGGNIGIELLKSFIVTFDSAGGAVYLQPTGTAPVIERERAGIRTEFFGDKLTVVYVSPDGPAAKAGLKTGDRIVAVDGAKVDAKFYDRPDWTRLPAGQSVTLAKSDGSTAKVTLADYY
jgi:hypothetical protein